MALPLGISSKSCSLSGEAVAWFEMIFPDCDWKCCVFNMRSRIRNFTRGDSWEWACPIAAEKWKHLCVIVQNAEQHFRSHPHPTLQGLPLNYICEHHNSVWIKRSRLVMKSISLQYWFCCVACRNVNHKCLGSFHRAHSPGR